jgi:hypothetical protein
MIPENGPKRALTEAAIHMLAAVRVEARSAVPLGEARPRILAGRFGVNDPAELRRHSLVVRSVSITEAYIDGLFSELMEEQVPNPSDFLLRIMAKIEDIATTDWAKRHEHYSELYELQLTACTTWPLVDAAIDIRNAILHGLGALTARLRRKRGLMQAVHPLGASVGGGRIHLSEESPRRVSNACRELILDLDDRT